MKERPILFSGPMVRAILDGRKTQTRRIVKAKTSFGDIATANAIHRDGSGNGFIAWWGGAPPQEITAAMYPGDIGFKCPYGIPGDLLWVRESWSTSECMDSLPPRDTKDHGLPFWYIADGRCRFTGAADGGVSFLTCGKLRPSIHMPRWASRISLEITGVRGERLQAMSCKDAISEGLNCVTKDGSLYKYGIADRDRLPGNDDYGWHWGEWEVDPRMAYKKLWESINGPGSWDANPWVWVVEFKRI